MLINIRGGITFNYQAYYFQDVYTEFERCQADIIKLRTTVQQFSEGKNLVLS